MDAAAIADLTRARRHSGTFIAPSSAVSHLRYREYVPPMPSSDARRLRGLPSCWAEPIGESEIDGLERRAGALALTLARRGRKREADELGRRVALLRRIDGLHGHAEDLEIVAGLYRALSVFSNEHDSAAEESFVWAQTGVLGDDASLVGHGPAFRETAALRNRAFRLVASALAAYARELGMASR